MMMIMMTMVGLRNIEEDADASFTKTVGPVQYGTLMDGDHDDDGRLAQDRTVIEEDIRKYNFMTASGLMESCLLSSGPENHVRSLLDHSCLGMYCSMKYALDEVIHASGETNCSIIINVVHESFL
jgi:hypothetical protein